MLRPSSADFRALFEAAPGNFIVVLSDVPTFTVVAASDAYVRFASTQRDRLIGRSIADVFPAEPDLEGSLMASLRRVISTKAEDTSPIASASATSTNSPVIGHDGAVQFIICRIDISRESNTRLAPDAQYRSLLDAIDDGFSIIEKVYHEGQPGDYRFLEVNPAFTALFGPDAVAGQTLRDVHPGEHDELVRILDSVERTGKPVRFERSGPLPGRTLEFRALRLKDENCHRVGVLISDITSRKQVDEIQQQERLRRALEVDQGVGSWDYNVPLNLVYADARCAELFSVDPGAAAAGLPLSDFAASMHEDDRERVNAAIQHAAQIGGEYAEEYRVVRKDGSIRIVLARGRCQLNAAGSPERFAGVVVDLTERKSFELRDAFLLQLDDSVRPLTDAPEITQLAARLLGEHLNVNRCAYADVEADEDTFNLTGDYNRGVPSIVGRYTFTQFGAECLRLMREGKPYVVVDSETDPRTADVRESYRMTRIRSVICVSLMKKGKFVAAMAVHQITPRYWTSDEVELVQQVANRCWESIERSRVERELREREQRYRFLAESIPQMVWTATADGATDYVNARVTRYFGADETSVLGAGWLNWVHPEDRDQAIERWTSAIATGGNYEASQRLRRGSDGSWRWHLVRGHPLIGEDGRVRQWFGTCTDIEDQKRAGEELRRQWHTFDTALSNTPDLIHIFDVEGRVIYANRALLEVWERSYDDSVGKTLRDLEYPDDLATKLERQFQDVAATGRRILDETPFTSPSGATRNFEYIFAPLFAPDGRVEAIAGSTRDITERKRLEQALRDSEARLQQVFAQAPVAIVVFRGREFVVELANPYYEAMVSGRQLTGRRLADIIPELSSNVWEAFHHVVETGEPFLANEYPIQYDKDGDGISEDHWFNVVYNPLRDPDGTVSGIVAVCSDVTVQVLARHELERVNRELEEFAYVASHDLQEPLRMVNIYNELMLREFISNDPNAQQYAAFIKKGVGRMATLIRNLLTYSRAVQRDETPVGEADLSSALRESLSVLKNRIDETGAIITADALPTVRGDTQQMAHVFQNLLSNALKYHKPEMRPEIQISAELKDSTCIVSIRDNGIGFEQQYADRIFGLFKRLHKDEYPGTGLGLAICKRLIERVGGRIWAEGIEGNSATFYFELPLIDPH